MDVLDAGVWVSKWTADAPRHTKVTLWGPLQAREMGFEGWDVQDGGETGFVMHHQGAASMGRSTATLIFVRRLEKAFLTVYLGGYPADAPEEQRRLDTKALVGACELFLKRLAKQPVSFRFDGELALVDNYNDATVDAHAGKRVPVSASALAGGSPTPLLGGGRLARKAPVIDADTGREATDAPSGVRVKGSTPNPARQAPRSEAAPTSPAAAPSERSVAQRTGIEEVNEKGRSPTRVWEV